jgi:hypothetical protein
LKELFESAIELKFLATNNPITLTQGVQYGFSIHTRAGRISQGVHFLGRKEFTARLGPNRAAVFQNRRGPETGLQRLSKAAV